MRKIFRAKRAEYLSQLRPQDKGLAFSVPPTPLRDLFQPGRTVAAYIALNDEADPSALLDAAHAAGCKTALPHVSSKAAPMQFLPWNPGEALEKGIFGLQQPKQGAGAIKPDIILVPLVAFDRRLSRIGQGAGHYDRALSLLGDSIAIGVAWSVQEAEIIAADPWDVPLDAILTEKEWISQ